MMMQELWKLKEAGQLNAQQMLWFEAPGEERLFDTKKDPFELHDLSADTAYADDLVRMRQQMESYLSSIEDWSDEPENDMVQRFQPRGITEKTPVPEIKEQGDQLEITAIEGASIGYQIDEGRWQLYQKPVSITASQTLKAKAVRYGWEESEEVVFTAL